MEGDISEDTMTRRYMNILIEHSLDMADAGSCLAMRGSRIRL